MDQDYANFIVKIKKANTKKKFKITGSFGMLHYYRYFNKHKSVKYHKFSEYSLSFDRYSEIITACNQKLVQNLLSGKKTTLPCRLGTLYILKYDIQPRLDANDNLIYKAPIDWNKTLEFWYKTPEAYEKKITIRRDPGYFYKIIYVKGYFKNRPFIEFSSMRKLRQDLKNNIIENKLDALVKLT